MASDQIRQMVNFILQEAHEKANEIRVKVCLSFYVLPSYRSVAWKKGHTTVPVNNDMGRDSTLYADST
jgi:hypothetical protein